MTKIWHDDIRRPPNEDWVWCRTNEQAQHFLKYWEVNEISLDHDLGLDYLDPDCDTESWAFAGSSPKGTGLDLVEWMCIMKLVPEKVTIHSWNPVGAQNMAARLNYFGYDCIVKPFNPYEGK